MASCTKGKVLEQEMAAGTEGRDEHPHRYRYESEHGEERLPCVFRNVNESRWHEVLANEVGLLSGAHCLKQLVAVDDLLHRLDVDVQLPILVHRGNAASD